MVFKTKRIYRLVVSAFIAVVAILPSVGNAQAPGEKIDAFQVYAAINPDATVTVQEQILYNFGGQSRHGIFRTIPIKYETGTGNRSITIKDIKVENEAGIAYPFTTSKQGKNLEIKIGDPETFVTGSKIYVIQYTVEKSIGYFEEYDEWYWNFTGHDWDVPIGNIGVTIDFPKTLPGKDIRLACYEGGIGSTQSCSIGDTSTEFEVKTLQFAEPLTLPVGEGVTIAVGFPKGIVYEPTTADKIGDFLRDNYIAGLPIVVLIGMFILWWNKGKDPKGRGTVIPEYETPDNLTPLEVSALMYQGARNRDISAEIVYLATKGYLKITRIEEKKFLSTQTDYILTRLKTADEKLPHHTSELLNALFDTSPVPLVTKGHPLAVGISMLASVADAVADGVKATNPQEVPGIKLSDLKNKFYTRVSTIKKEAMSSVVNKGYYAAHPERVMGMYIGAAVAVGFILWFVVGLISLNVVTIVSLVISAIIVLVFSYFMPRATQFGAQTRERIQGLKMYIEVAEADRIKFHNAPEKSPELFEKLLPYAMVLGLEAQWVKQFEGIFTTPPSWYSDAHISTFNAVVFANSISSFSMTAASTLASSAAGGGSGSGGGGFSGGGFGGGGGGSW